MNDWHLAKVVVGIYNTVKSKRVLSSLKLLNVVIASCWDVSIYVRTAGDANR